MKNGRPFNDNKVNGGTNVRKLGRITKPELGDERNYIEVVIGRTRVASKPKEPKNVIPVLFTLNCEENLQTTETLKHAIIVESTDVLDHSKMLAHCSRLKPPYSGMYSLSTTKLLFVFDSENHTTEALNDGSDYWAKFNDVRQWSEGEFFGDQVVWLECFGLNPKCWSVSNITKIGEKWSPVLAVEQSKDGINNLTYAKLLV